MFAAHLMLMTVWITNFYELAEIAFDYCEKELNALITYLLGSVFGILVAFYITLSLPDVALTILFVGIISALLLYIFVSVATFTATFTYACYIYDNRSWFGINKFITTITNQFEQDRLTAKEKREHARRVFELKIERLK